MCHGEVRASEYEDAFGRPFSSVYRDELAALESFEADGLLRRESDGSLEVTPTGRMLVRNVAMVFDAYLDAQRESGVKMFSRTI